MNKILSFLIAAFILTACNNDGEGSENPVDSIQERKDSLIEKVDSSFEQKIDSLEERKEELKEKFDSAAEKRIDSVKNKS